MKVSDALQDLTRLFLDSSPVIYYIDANPKYLSVMDSIFDCLNSEQIRAFTSPVTLAECLVLPTRQNDSEKRQVFVKIDIPIAQHAAEIRVKYNLKLPDALQIATALVSNCEAFLTNDVQLKRVTELQVLVISELEV